MRTKNVLVWQGHLYLLGNPKILVMALYYDLPVFKDVYKMTLRIFELTSNFSREYKYTLGQDLKRDYIFNANV